MSLSTLPKAPRTPDGLSLEKPAKNLASLATSDSLRELTDVVLAQWRRSDRFAPLARHGIRPIDRMLFYGPPGNGKTMASQWLAKQLEAPLYRVRCESLVASQMGATSARMSEVLDWLEKQPRCVVLFDEVEQLFMSRQMSEGACGRELSTVMQVFWQRLDRWEEPTLFVLATNLPDSLDPALLSRIDLQIEFGPPTTEQAASVLAYWAETLHEYGGEIWGPDLSNVPRWDSFRALFQAVQHRVREHVTRSEDT